VTRRPLWTCPRCGERFISPRLWHSCGRHSFDALFARREPQVRQIFDRLAALARRCGPVRVYPQKTRAVMQVRIRFVSAYPQKQALVAGFLLPPKMRSTRFFQTLDGVSAHYVVRYVRFTSVDEVDASVERWMRAAYAIGEQRHLNIEPRTRTPERYR
jgi:hypothetical protein